MTTENKRLIRLKEAAGGVLPVSYATLFRLSKQEGPFLDAFYAFNGVLFVDPDRFIEIGKKEARKRTLER